LYPVPEFRLLDVKISYQKRPNKFSSFLGIVVEDKMNAKSQKRHILLLILLKCAVFMPVISCQSAPPPQYDPPPTVEPVQQALGQNELNRLDAAMARATGARENALAVQGSVHFPDEWAQAESDYQAGRGVGRATLEALNQAVASFTAAADLYEFIAENSAPLFARYLEEARLAQEALDRENAQRNMQAALTRAEQARRDAQANRANNHFPAEWREAEAQLRAGRVRRGATPDEMMVATEVLTAVAVTYDDLAERSRPLFERDEAQRALNAAITRADRSRRAAMNANGHNFFPNDWRNAEAQNQAGVDAPRNTASEVQAATALFAAAADSYDDIAQRSGPLLARERDEANGVLQAAMARAGNSRQAAMDVEGQIHFPTEWRNAETQNTAANRARRNTLDEMRAATALFVTAADSYDDIARRSRPMAAAARTEANREFQAAVTRVDRSRRAAMDVEGQTHFPNDWNRAESQNTSGRNAPRNTIGETRAVIAQLNSAADGFDNIAQRSGDMFARARDDANSALQAAMARADSSRQAAVNVEAQTFFPAEWRTAEAQNTAARRARRNTTEEMRAATTMFVEAANSYDDLARRSGSMFAAERNEAERDLQAAITRAAQARQQAENTDAATNLPRDWRNIETRHRNAENARRGTLAEIRSTTNLFVGVANAFDDIVQRNIRLAEQNEAAAQVARAAAERERQAALDARANVAATEDFNRADATFQQALRDYNARNFTAARTQYTQSANQFVASVRETERRRRLADVAVEQARQRSAQSTAHAISVGLAMEEDSDT